MIRWMKFIGGLLLLGIAAIFLFDFFSIFTTPVTGLLATTTLGTLPWEDWELAGYAVGPIILVVAIAVFLIVLLAKGKDSDQGL